MKNITTISVDYHPPMHAGQFYHVFNRTNNKEPLFKDDDDRFAFLERFPRFISPYMEIFSYCLMGNHFHLLIRVKTIEEITAYIEAIPPVERKVGEWKFLLLPEEEKTTDSLISSQFVRFFTSYSMYFNTRHSRKGNLFTRRFKRVEIANTAQLQYTVYYIHANPVKHKIKKDFTDYRWSSYQSLMEEENIDIEISFKEVFRWFGGKRAFKKFHSEMNIPETGEPEGMNGLEFN